MNRFFAFTLLALMLGSFALGGMAMASSSHNALDGYVLVAGNGNGAGGANGGGAGGGAGNGGSGGAGGHGPGDGTGDGSHSQDGTGNGPQTGGCVNLG